MHLTFKSALVEADVIMAATAMLVVAVSSSVVAQMPTGPNSRTKLSPPPVTAKPRPMGRVKSCSVYGEGFVNVPGTDACIKIGGLVTIEGTVSPGN